MRTVACSVQQTLTSEAASVLKHSVSLARGRGHAQVTPLHVAATLLSSRASLLRRACLKSHPHSLSHSLQSRALELCFNVALNRLPTIPTPLLHTQPSLSNALVAALKRAQAHQRRGCIEQQQQQQPLLAIKVELEQLIISILDDPSVSRVMMEAGFSSTCVKNNLEDTSPPPMFYTSGHGALFASSCGENDGDSSFWPSSLLFHSQKKQSLATHFMEASSETSKDDLSLVMEVLLRKKRRNAILVADSLSVSERLVSRLMEKMERGDVPQELKSIHFIKFTLSSFSLSFMKREDVELKVADLRRRVSSLVSTGGAIIYAGDLKWAVEDHGNVVKYSPIVHIVTEIGRLVSDFSCFNSKVWLLGLASYQTYMRCQMRTPPLDIQWSLHAVPIPSGGLGLSLHSPARYILLNSPE